MEDERDRTPCAIDTWAESLIVLALAGISNGRTKQRLYRSLRDIEPARIEAATERLLQAGVIEQHGTHLVQSPALERLDRLDLICI